MKFRKYLIPVILLFSSTTIYSQKISKIDFDKIKAMTQDSLSFQYYPVLLERFQSFDTTLSFEDYNMIYYGNVFTEMYNPYAKSESEKTFIDLYKKEKYDEAIQYGLSSLKENPVNLTVLFKLLVIYHHKNDMEKANAYAMLYYNLLGVIYLSGDGKSPETAMVVVNVSDEYEIIAELQLRNTSQALVGNCDLMTFDTKAQKVEKGQKKIKKLYFNVSKPLDYLNKLFK